MTSRARPGLRALAVLGAAAAWPASALPAQDVGYNQDVRPILSRNCFDCHGPDAAQRQAGLRLDVPGQAGLAPIVARITAADPDEVMPPPESGRSLSPAQVDVLRRWVAGGARYERHWAFVPPVRPPLPPGDGAGHPIDRFVRARLAAAGLEPSPPADRLTLARRVYLDLIGLPPTPEAADAFARDDAPGAYERLVDGLLASPRYGERWARRWLDLARYADTNGYEKDRDRSIWPYRDWVIRALNADMPFDRFAIEQLAGDMLPEPTVDQLVATGFHRNTMLNEEGGIDPLEFRFHAVTDRVAVTGTVFLGLTLGCAQCHSHKFDPISHREYYELMAFLDNADEPDLVLPPTAAAEQAAERRLAQLRALPPLSSRWPAAAGPLDERVDAWIEELRGRAAPWTPLVPERAEANVPVLTIEGDAVLATGDTTKHDVYRLWFAPAGREVTALRLEALPDDRLPGGGPGTTYYEGTKGDFFLAELAITAADAPVAIAAASESYANNGFGRRPVSAALATDGDLQTGWSVAGRSGERHVAVFVLERSIAAGAPLCVELHFGRHFSSSLGKLRISATDAAGGGAALALGADLEALLAGPRGAIDAAARSRLRDAFLDAAPEVAEFAAELRRLRRPPDRATTLIFRERPAAHPRPTHRHHRGEFLQPRERVEPGVPAALHPLPAGAPRDRLGFARWLVSRDNPLVARVVVNRHWAALFGEGLVRTVADFGAQGELPSHPQLLDWLAVEFMAHGWSLKWLHRQIVTSATYRQSSVVTAPALARDPDNRLLSRAPRFRLEAEILRDAALAAAGILSDEMFGPPVRPPQPPGVTEVAFGKPQWRPSQGADRYRRSLYTYSKRTAPFAMYQTFDAPSGETCTARRDRADSALQALTLLNDPMLVEIAQALGRRLAAFEARHGEAAALRRAFRLVLTRPPSRDEAGALARFVTEQRHAFAADREVAAQVAGAAPDDEPGDEPDPVAAATWTALARALSSLDEAITRN